MILRRVMPRARTMVVATLSLTCAGAADQRMLLDRPLGGEAPIALRGGRGLPAVGDRFQVGATGETWVIDTVRTWVVVGRGSSAAGRLGDAFEKIVLFGGIETADVPGQPKCDCHDLMRLKTALLSPGSDVPAAADVKLSWGAPGILELEFRRIEWSAPGGTPLQFTVMAEPRAGNAMRSWESAGARVGGTHELRLFSLEGKLAGKYEADGAVAPEVGIPVQAWGHKPAIVGIRPSESIFEVSIDSNKVTFDAAQTDRASLRFGPNAAAPVSVASQVVDGRTRIVARFRRSESGVTAGDVTACLSGKLVDGMPFEGCDLLRKK